MFFNGLWYPLLLDLEPELLTVLTTEGRRPSPGKPMASSLPLLGRNPGESWSTSSFESLKKLIALCGIAEPFELR
jgi:hypothetical protein